MVDIDDRLLKILVCPQCKGRIEPSTDARGLVCGKCQLKFPIRDGIPVMMVDEATDIKSGIRSDASNVKVPRVTFRVIRGPDANMAFQLEDATCRAIGRSPVDPNRTSVFNVDLAMALDEGTRDLILRYIGRQFSQRAELKESAADRIGGFRRSADVTLTDPGLSRLHAMVFAEGGKVGILDLVSKNGTFISGSEIESKLLEKGDVIELGETAIVFES